MPTKRKKRNSKKVIDMSEENINKPYFVITIKENYISSKTNTQKSKTLLRPVKMFSIVGVPTDALDFANSYLKSKNLAAQKLKLLEQLKAVEEEEKKQAAIQQLKDIGVNTPIPSVSSTPVSSEEVKQHNANREAELTTPDF